MPRPDYSTFSQRTRNFSASLLLLLTTGLFYWLVPQFQSSISKTVHLFSYQFLASDALQIFAVIYCLLLLIFYFTEKQPGISKSIHCLRGIKRIIQSPAYVYREGLSKEERLGILATLLKAFFAPMMLVSLLSFLAGLMRNGTHLFTSPELLQSGFLTMFNSYGFWFLFQLILFIDVCFFSMGYLVEMPRL
jgi:hypothetical protein